MTTPTAVACTSLIVYDKVPAGNKRKPTRNHSIGIGSELVCWTDKKNNNLKRRKAEYSVLKKKIIKNVYVVKIKKSKV